MSSVRVLGTLPLLPNWTDRLSATSGDSWTSLEAALRADPKWKPDQVDSVAAESLRVLRHLPDPQGDLDFQGRGLVVGYVQSGKTANYTAVAARAVDAGYRLVIVLSGIHDALRNQTQRRLQRELVGAARPGQHEWRLLTHDGEDFRAPADDALDHAGPFLIVAKKIVPILERLDEWLSSAGDRLHWLPALIIDDEADQASINTRGNRKPDLMVSEAEDAAANGPKPSATNLLIRSVLSRLPRAAYIAYTATPFANIFIDPHAVDRDVGEDLFPRDFALQLPRPEGYTGTEELFGPSAEGRDVRRSVPDDDVLKLRTSTRRRPTAITVKLEEDLVPPTLTEALLTFCVAGAIRELREGGGIGGHTMLVHVSQRVIDQARIASNLREQIDLWRAAGERGESLAALFGKALADNLRGTSLPAAEDLILARAEAVMDSLVVLELNSATGENLEYEEKPGRHIVAVGGNRLSRGLTLEGLTISYFLRTTTMTDTLLQMARWYGFRSGYEDLIRIWTTDGIARWFCELALVEESLRDALAALNRAGRRPDQMAIRLRAHSELMLTARNKSTMSDEVQDSWSGDHPQTILLPLQDPRRLQANRSLTDRFLALIRPRFATEGGLLAQDLSAADVVDFLQAYRTHDDTIAFRGDQLSEWILRREQDGELTDWSVFLAGSAGGRKVLLGGQEIGLVSRKRLSSESIGILIDPRHEGVDLAGGPSAYRRSSGSYDAGAMRVARPPTQGLLIIYPLDPEPLAVSETDTVIALALSLPRTSDAARSWIVNRGLVDA
jgi:hypothetical protein